MPIIFYHLRLPHFLHLSEALHIMENLHSRHKPQVNYVNCICTQVMGALRPHLLNTKAKNTQLHKDIVCHALLVIGRLIFMFWLNKQLSMLSIVSCFALKTQLANAVSE